MCVCVCVCVCVRMCARTVCLVPFLSGFWIQFLDFAFSAVSFAVLAMKLELAHTSLQLRTPRIVHKLFV